MATHSQPFSPFWQGGHFEFLDNSNAAAFLANKDKPPKADRHTLRSTEGHLEGKVPWQCRCFGIVESRILIDRCAELQVFIEHKE